MIDPSNPVPGFYRLRLVAKGIGVPVRIWFGQPIVDGEELDRSPRLCVEVNGRTCRFERDADDNIIGRVPLDPLADNVWPYCAADPITQHEFEFMKRRATWATEFAPDHPAANPYEPVNVRSLPPAF